MIARARVRGVLTTVLFTAGVTVLTAQQPTFKRTILQQHDLSAPGREVHVIGGADVAAELDAKRAIAQGTALAARL